MEDEARLLKYCHEYKITMATILLDLLPFLTAAVNIPDDSKEFFWFVNPDSELCMYST